MGGIGLGDSSFGFRVEGVRSRGLGLGLGVLCDAESPLRAPTSDFWTARHCKAWNLACSKFSDPVHCLCRSKLRALRLKGLGFRVLGLGRPPLPLLGQDHRCS